MLHFGMLARDGKGDYDGDGISDLDEYLAGTPPAFSTNAPSIPVIFWPEDGTEVTMPSPALTVENGTDPDGDPITYQFELYADEAMTSLLAGQVNMPEGQGTTSWTVPEILSDNTSYFWRVRATDGFVVTKWAYGRFFVKTANDLLTSFAISSPQDGTEVDTLRSTLKATNSVDADHDQLTYTFEVYADSSMSTLVAAALDIEAGQKGTTRWGIDANLDDNTSYFWRAIATDEHGGANSDPIGLIPCEYL